MCLKKIFFHSILFTLILYLLVPSLSAQEKLKNIIFMVPDGMGLANVTAARIFAYGPGKLRLRLETLKEIGYQSNFSANSIVTDSAAAASAWACGEKFNNGEISFHGDTGAAPETILQISKQLGKSTGLLATSAITHATPAAFGAHVKKRSCENEIARQYLEETGIDVLLGGGKLRFALPGKMPDACGVRGDFINLAEHKGYKVVYTREDMLAAQNARKVLGLFSEKEMSPAQLRANSSAGSGTQEPTLAEMTRIALKILEKNDKGFFLLVEGSQVDWANHDNNLAYQVAEILEFDQAVGEVLGWIEQEKARQDNTLLIVVPDHDTGGFAVNGPYGSSFSTPGQYVEPAWVSKKHTGVDTIIWSQGPYSRHLGRAIDNTDVFHVMKAALYGKIYTQENSNFLDTPKKN